MKTSTPNSLLTLPSLLLALALSVMPSALHAQGSLTPPGAPAPVFKTLDEVKPGTPISSLPFTITMPGVYFLTKNITTTGDGIIINTNDVVLDLGGFTLTGDGGVGDYGVDTTTRVHVAVRNGTVRNFDIGLNLGVGAKDMLIEDVLLIENTGAGLWAVNNALPLLTRSVLRRVRAVGNGSGITLNTFSGTTATQNVIEQCEAINNSFNGIVVSSPGNLIISCRASGNSNANYNIGVSNRCGIIVSPAVNVSSITGSSGGTAITTDPFANLSF